MSAKLLSVIGLLLCVFCVSSRPVLECATPLHYNVDDFLDAILDQTLEGLMKDRSDGRILIPMNFSESISNLWLTENLWDDEGPAMAVELYRIILWFQNARLGLIKRPRRCPTQPWIHHVKSDKESADLCDPLRLSVQCMDALESDAYSLLRVLAFQNTLSNDEIDAAMNCHFRDLVDIELPKQKRVGCAIFEDGIRGRLYSYDTQ